MYGHIKMRLFLLAFFHFWCSDIFPAALKSRTELWDQPGRVGACPPCPSLSMPEVHSRHVGCVTQAL